MKIVSLTFRMPVKRRPVPAEYDFPFILVKFIKANFIFSAKQVTSLDLNKRLEPLPALKFTGIYFQSIFQYY